MLPPQLFRYRGLVAANVAAMLFSFGMFGSIFFLAQFFQTVQHLSPLAAGLRILPWTAAPVALASGVDLQTVSRALGHESTAITSRVYLHAVETLQDDAAARIDALLAHRTTSSTASSASGARR